MPAQWYTDFASNISYYDFQAEDSVPISLDVKARQALRDLVQLEPLDVQSLSNLLQTKPDLVHGIEVLFRDQAFSKGQWIFLLFDVQVLNRPVDDAVRNYIRVNLTDDRNLREIVTTLTTNTTLSGLLVSGKWPTRNEDWTPLVATFKAALVEFIRKPGAINARLSNPQFATDRRRIAEYLITRLGLGDFVQAVDLEKYATWKRRGKDTKGLHGSFGQNRLRGVLERRGFADTKRGSARLQYAQGVEFAGIASKQKRRKEFDFLLFRDGEVRAAIETNFSETEGTKIGINVEEYLELAREVQRHGQTAFYWVTDGAVWLTPTGRRRLEQLYDGFSGHIYNYNTFERDLPTLMREWDR